jgi:hypothetical protein
MARVDQTTQSMLSMLSNLSAMLSMLSLWTQKKGSCQVKVMAVRDWEASPSNSGRPQSNVAIDTANGGLDSKPLEPTSVEDVRVPSRIKPTSIIFENFFYAMVSACNNSIF